MRTLLVTALAALALAAAPAHAAPLGALAPAGGGAGCVSEIAGQCTLAAALDGAAAVALSPDGRHAYVASATADAVSAFARDAGTGRLTQLAGTDACVSETGSAGRCVDGRGLDGANAVAVSPDGESVYVGARNGDAVAAFARDAASGRLTQLAGPAGCISETGSGAQCLDGRMLEHPASLAVSGDGRSVYVASRESDAVAVLSRDALTGAISQPAGADGCVSEAGAGGCTAGRALDGATAVAVQGERVYVAARVDDAALAFARDPASGRLAQLAGADGCASRTGAEGCAALAGLDGAAGVAVAPDGGHVFVAGAVSRGLVALGRTASGGLGAGSCLSEVPDDATRGTVGCRQGHALADAQAVAVSPDGRSVYVAARGANGLAVLARDPEAGSLGYLAGASGCVTDSGSGGACLDGSALSQPAHLAATPDGRAVYVAASASDAVAALARNASSGAPVCDDVRRAATAGTSATVAVSCRDAEGDALAFEVVSPPSHGTLGALDASGSASYTPAAGFTGEDRLLVRASDSAERSRVATVAIDVAPPPRPPRPPRNRPPSPRTTFLLSRALDGGFANGPSRNAVVSHDQRIARWMAFESDATNLVEGDSNGHTDVFAVARAGTWGQNGTPWTPGPVQLASTGLGGQPANGRSYRPALDGDAHHAPRCLAFVSEASNLVPGDTNGHADAFVRDLRSGRIARVSVDAAGRQASGPTSEVQVDGNCERVAFVADAPNLALARTRKPGWRSLVTRRPRAGTRQVYVRVLRGVRHDRGFRGVTFLASASDRGAPANGHAWEVALARDGKSLAFTSEATNLDRGDRGRGTDVYRRAFPRQYRHLGHGRGVQQLVPDTRLVSATRAGRAGNGPSRHPSITDQGRWVAFETHASNLLAGDGNGVSDIARADLGKRRVSHVWVSRSRHVGRPGNGHSNRPVISGAGEFVLFDSEASNLKPSASVRDDANGVRDVFLWNAPTGNVSLESRDSDNGYLTTPSQHPSTSSRGNYVPFESANPLIDIPLADRLLPDLLDRPELLDPRLVAPLIDPDSLLPQVPQLAAAGDAPLAQQVWMRYLGPK